MLGQKNPLPSKLGSKHIISTCTWISKPTMQTHKWTKNCEHLHRIPNPNNCEHLHRIANPQPLPGYPRFEHVPQAFSKLGVWAKPLSRFSLWWTAYFNGRLLLPISLFIKVFVSVKLGNHQVPQEKRAHQCRQEVEEVLRVAIVDLVREPWVCR